MKRRTNLTNKQRKEAGLGRFASRLDHRPTKAIEDPRRVAKRRMCRMKDRRQQRQWE